MSLLDLVVIWAGGGWERIRILNSVSRIRGEAYGLGKLKTPMNELGGLAPTQAPGPTRGYTEHCVSLIILVIPARLMLLAR